jgi:hypothetical protein
LPAIAQNDTIPAQKPKYAIYLELGGSGGFYSLNVERVFNGRFTLRGGYTYLSIKGGMIDFPESVVPLSTSVLFDFGNGTSFAEIGIGGTLIGYNGKMAVVMMPILGIREQDMSKRGAMGRISFTPFFLPYEKELHLWGGVSVGYGF